MKHNAPTPEDVIEKYGDRHIQLKIVDMQEYVLLEGSCAALCFLSELFAAQARAVDDGIGLSPVGAGRAWFAPGSTRGLYVHRIREEVQEHGEPSGLRGQ